KKCHYCSFPVYAGAKAEYNDYIDCLNIEAKKYKGSRVDSIYLGGGTPTRLDNKALDLLFRLIRDNFNYKKSAEFTIEANPEDITQEKLLLIKERGITRISLGIQSLNDKYLRLLGRNHDSALALKAYFILRDNCFNNVNVDFMYGFPGQAVKELKEDLSKCASLKSEHISVYSLSVEEKSKFFADKVRLSEEGFQAGLYLEVKKDLERLGYRQYEISNFSLPGKESKHNMNYWRCGEYIGLGVGAHSHLNGVRKGNTANYFTYMKDVKAKGEAVSQKEELADYDKLKEAFLFGLRMNDGVDLSLIVKRFGVELKPSDMIRVEFFIKNKFLCRKGGRISATVKGMLVLDEICGDLI
ncbi:MAG: radical SAM family heme chaperone HemW, partial [Candidatus Omnitrophica bacterium]|nr:radical SAM family heme chaperone HemW [Candidatus Omnitrophota bacterium]